MIKSGLNKALIGAGAALSLLLTVGASDAGQAGNYASPTCYKSADGSGACYGSAADFRKSADASALVIFEADSGPTYSGGGSFAATLNNVSYYCNIKAGTGPAALLTQAVLNKGLFYVQWDATGTCSYMRVYNDTATY